MVSDTFRFYCKDDKDLIYTATIEQNKYMVTWIVSGEERSAPYNKDNVDRYLVDGGWIILTDPYENLNYERLDGKYVDAHELISFLHGISRSRDINFEDVIGHVFSHLKV